MTITITDREINEINNHPKRYGNVYIEKSYEGTEGKQKLNGKQALAYCRIRKIDTDNARADRQKTVLLQVFKKMKGSSTTELLKWSTTWWAMCTPGTAKGTGEPGYLRAL